MKRVDIVETVCNVNEFEKVAIKEALLNIDIDTHVHRFIHFLLGKSYSRFVEMGMLPYFDYVKEVQPVVFPELSSQAKKP